MPAESTQETQHRTPPPPRVSRLAPSPTGALHLGNARTFLINWAMARRQGWRLVLRIEDLDTPRVKRGADVQAIDDLRWLGIEWDGAPLYQRADLSPYDHALTELALHDLIYPCSCTRAEIDRAQSAPHADEHETRYPGTCRGRVGTFGMDELPRAFDPPMDSKRQAWRVVVPEGTIGFTDELHGPQSVDVQATVGDFIVATKAGLPAYQLAVVVDDERQRITDVIRGDDLLPVTARQILLYSYFNFARIPPPRYWHVPLVVGPDGRRLAKRHGDTRLAWYREHRVPVERIIGLIAEWSGVAPTRAPMTAAEFRDRFDLSHLPRRAIPFTPEDHAWLLAR